MNVTYAYLAKGRDLRQLDELDQALAVTPAEKQLSVDERNAREMERFMRDSGMGALTGPKPVPLPHKRRTKPPDG